jgi:condensin-2 complex subunit H2
MLVFHEFGSNTLYLCAYDFSLEDYLEELEEITISVEGGETNLNFAEAALLIQGSTCIYGRKVEHLYNLVLQTIELLTQRGNVKFGADNRRTSLGGKSDGTGDDGGIETFLLLDDIIEEGKDIDLPLDPEGERTGSRKGQQRRKGSVCIDRPPLFLLGHDSGGGFRMSTCTVDRNGALMLDAADADDAEMSAVEGEHVADSYPVNSPHHSYGEEVGGGAMSCDDSDMGSAIDPREAMGESNFETGIRAHAGGDDMMQTEAEGSGPDGENKVWTDPRSAAAAAIVVPARVEVDPWAPLDPHDQGAVASKAFRKGRTFRIPNGVAAASNARTSKGQARVAGDAGRILAMSIGLSGLMHSEFDYLYKFLRQRKDAARRRRAQAAADLLVASGEYDDASVHDYGDGDDDDGDADSNHNGADNWFGPDVGAYSDDEEAMLGGGEGELNLGPLRLDDTYGEAPDTYEALCRSHVQSFLRGAERYARETKLSRRVDTWQQHLEPLLVEQDSRKPFDIHEYGRGILKGALRFLQPADQMRLRQAKSKENCMSSDDVDGPCASDPVSFSKITAGKERYDVCRMFLASLQLANSGNVTLLHKDFVEEKQMQQSGRETLSMEIRDLRTRREMEDYMAPSAALL